MKLFNNHSGLRGLPCFAEGIYWATGLSLTTPFTEGCPGVNNKASPPGRHQEQAPKQRCTFSPTTFSSVQELQQRVDFRSNRHSVPHRPGPTDPHSRTCSFACTVSRRRMKGPTSHVRTHAAQARCNDGAIPVISASVATHASRGDGLGGARAAGVVRGQSQTQTHIRRQT